MAKISGNCQTQRRPCNGRAVERHHQYRKGAPASLRNNPANMQWLCRRCHHQDGHNGFSSNPYSQWPDAMLNPNRGDGLTAPFVL